MNEMRMIQLTIKRKLSIKYKLQTTARLNAIGLHGGTESGVHMCVCV